MKNAALDELKAIMGIGSRFGTPWRPVEQGAVERMHQEASRERGLLLLEVFRCFGTEWASVLPALEFLLYTTPRADTGVCPRDLDRRWSLATPLERVLLLFQVPAQTSVSEVARAEFAGFVSSGA
jgi:hypothetical protein